MLANVSALEDRPILTATDFSNLVSELRPRLERHAYHITADQDSAEDAAAHAIARTWQRFQAGVLDVHSASIMKYLFRAAKNRAIDFQRQSKTISLDESSPGWTMADPDRCLEHVEAEILVGELLRHLRSDYRQTIILADLEGLSAKHGAQALDISVSTFKDRLYRARTILYRFETLQTKPWR